MRKQADSSIEVEDGQGAEHTQTACSHCGDRLNASVIICGFEKYGTYTASTIGRFVRSIASFTPD
jgi:hypothetical protein